MKKKSDEIDPFACVVWVRLLVITVSLDGSEIDRNLTELWRWQQSLSLWWGVEPMSKKKSQQKWAFWIFKLHEVMTGCSPVGGEVICHRSSRLWMRMNIFCLLKNLKWNRWIFFCRCCLNQEKKPKVRVNIGNRYVETWMIWPEAEILERRDPKKTKFKEAPLKSTRILDEGKRGGKFPLVPVVVSCQ